MVFASDKHFQLLERLVGLSNNRQDHILDRFFECCHPKFHSSCNLLEFEIVVGFGCFKSCLDGVLDIVGGGLGQGGGGCGIVGCWFGQKRRECVGRHSVFDFHWGALVHGLPQWVLMVLGSKLLELESLDLAVVKNLEYLEVTDLVALLTLLMRLGL